MEIFETILQWLLGMAAVAGVAIFIAWNESKSLRFFVGMESESVAIPEMNNRAIDMLLLSGKYARKNDWEIADPGDESGQSLEPSNRKPFLNLWWIGIYPFVNLATLHMQCKEFNADKSAVTNCGKASFQVIPLFHNHAYITPDVEIKGLGVSNNNGSEDRSKLRVRMKFLVRFRIVNPYKALYNTTNIIENLESALLGITKQNADDKTFDNLADGQAYIDSLKDNVNEEIKHYGVKIVGFHFIDLEGADQKTRDALEALKFAIMKSDADKAEAEGKKALLMAEVEAETERVKRIMEQCKNNPALVRAYALTKMSNLSAYSDGSSGGGHRQTFDINANQDKK